MQPDSHIPSVTALAVTANTAVHGATAVNALVPIQSFFESQVLPDLQAAAVPNTPIHQTPILIADALKFLSTFRQQLNREVFVSIIPNLVACLGSQSFVVSSYAAICIDRFLLIRDAGALR